MSKKRAFVRYSKQGKIVPGSLILTGGSHPNGPSTWKEVPADLCCNGGGTFTTEIVFPIVPDFPDQFFLGLGFVVRCNGDTILSYFIEYPLEIDTTQEVVDYLNSTLTGVATFSVVNFNTISVSFSQVIADALCPSGVLTVVPNLPA